MYCLRVDEFQHWALKIFNRQAMHNPVYREYIQNIGVNIRNVDRIDRIPFLPIEFFKYHAVKTGTWNPETVFESSGTTGNNTSKHAVKDMAFYREHSCNLFQSVYGSPTQYHIMALLPSYLERGNSSLVCMADRLIELSDSGLSGFYLNDYEQLFEQLIAAKRTDRKILLIGVSFALLDFVEHFSVDLNGHIVMETGGMKGRRKEMIREELHNTLQDGFNVRAVHSEYGMTELFSQLYMTSPGAFVETGTIKVMLRDINDPLDVSMNRVQGGLNIIDLANFSTCSFIETKDIGIRRTAGLEIMGRLDHSDVRGCSQLF